MDLLFKRYASPFSFIDGMLLTGRFSEFVNKISKTITDEQDEQKTWEYFLHRAYSFEGSFEDFKNNLRNLNKDKNLSERTVETTLQHTQNILNNFNPDEGGE